MGAAGLCLGDVDRLLWLHLAGLEDQGEPQAWELGHGLSGDDGCAGKPPPRALDPVHCRPLAGSLGRVPSRAHIFRSACVLAAAGRCSSGSVGRLGCSLRHHHHHGAAGCWGCGLGVGAQWMLLCWAWGARPLGVLVAGRDVLGEGRPQGAGGPPRMWVVSHGGAVCASSAPPQTRGSGARRRVGWAELGLGAASVASLRPGPEAAALGCRGGGPRHWCFSPA